MYDKLYQDYRLWSRKLWLIVIDDYQAIIAEKYLDIIQDIALQYIKIDQFLIDVQETQNNIPIAAKPKSGTKTRNISANYANIIQLALDKLKSELSEYKFKQWFSAIQSTSIVTLKFNIS